MYNKIIENKQPKIAKNTILRDSKGQRAYTILSKLSPVQGAKGKKKKGTGRFNRQ